MNRQLRLRDGKIKTAYWSLVGVVAALLVSTQAVFAADMWDRFSMIMKDIYGELVAISTIVAVTVAAIALLVRMISRNQRAVDEATSWLKRIVITWIVLNSLGFIVAYLQPLNLVSPEHSDSWNCMSDLNGDTLMAQVLTNVIIGNTSSGKGDHFWDNGEGNLLKALILLIDQDRTRSPDMKHLSAVYQLLTQNSERQLTAMFDKLPLDHPARAPFNLFAQSSDTVRSGIILGLGTRLQVLQNQAVQRITSRSDIDLTAPGRNKCIYYIVLSDQDATMAFLSSLFFSFMFIKLTRYADGRPNGRCDVPVNLILDEFNDVGRIGGAEDGSDFARSLSVVRSRDIRVMLAVQSLGQLQNRYPKNLWAEIIGNCDIQLMLGCTDDVTAEYISARSGDMSVQVNSTMTVRQTIAVAQVIPQYRHTEGQGRRRLLTPDEVLRLPNEELLCIIRGHNILKLNKLDFTRHPMAKQIVKASVYDYQPAADTLTPTPTQSDTEPVPPKKAARRKSLYSSAQPPSEF